MIDNLIIIYIIILYETAACGWYFNFLKYILMLILI